MDLSDDLLDLDWPESFIVVYRDGTSERLLRGSGVSVSLPDDDPDGIGAFCAEIPQKHPSNQKKGVRHVRFTDLAQLLGESGNVLYRAP